jgi:hypothetical protein
MDLQCAQEAIKYAVHEMENTLTGMSRSIIITLSA